MEIWKDIEGYEGLYQISNMGRIKSLNYRRTGKEKILKPSKNIYDYLYLNLSKDGKIKTCILHKIVALHFIPNPNNKPCIDHINTDRTDNRVENLRWVTHKENCNNPITIENYSKCRIGNKHPMYGRYGKLHPHSKPILQFSKDGELVRKWDSAKDVEKELNIAQTNITACCKGKQKTAGGYKWHYHYKSLWLKNHVPQIKRKKVA